MKRLHVLLLAVCALLAACSNAPASPAEGFAAVSAADEALTRAKAGSAVVFEDMKCTAGNDLWASFYAAVSREEAASVLCATYYVLHPEQMSEELYAQEKNQYPMLYYRLIEYDGKKFTVSTRESTQAAAESVETYPYLMHYTGKTTPPADKLSYDYYVLVDDQSLTWEDIEKGMFSSQLGASCRHCAVYMNTFAEGEATDE